MPIVKQQALVVAARQGGVITKSQLIVAGFSARQVEHRVATGELKPVIEGVYRLIPMKAWRDRVAAAAAGLPNAVASHQTAARLLGFPNVGGSGITVSVHSRTSHEWPGATVKRMADLDPTDITSVSSIPTTSPSRTLFDLASELDEQVFADLADTLASTGVVPTDRLARTAQRLCRRGKPGSGVVREYVGLRADQMNSSPLETRALQLLRSAGLQPETQYPIPWSPWLRFDLAFPGVRLAIEIDSFLWHATPTQFEADRRRDRDAVANGWIVLRFTWKDIEERPGEVLAEITHIISTRS